MTLTPEQEDARAGDEPVWSLLDSGALTPEWAETFKAVPRSLFLPDLLWSFDVATGISTPVDRAEDPAAWERAAEEDVPLVTQWDDGEHTGTDPGTTATSSASMPSLVARMLRDLDVRDGMRVLEVGTGTGWNAGLLAHRLGGAHVASVEIDPAVAERARAALDRAGLHPEVVRADGRDGRPDGAPYDRLIATAGVRAVPPSWLRQTRPGGLVLFPYGTHYSNQDALVRLTVHEDGSASGPFLEAVEFMKLRAQRLDWDRFHGYVAPFPGDAAVSRTRLTLADLGERFSTPLIVTALCVPDCAHVVNETDDGGARAWFFDLRSRSWAAAEFAADARDSATGAPDPTADAPDSTADAPDSTVYQSGPRPLWDEVERALTWWAGEGEPDLTRFGLTVRPDGTTIPWLDDPANVLPFPRSAAGERPRGGPR